MEREWLAEQLLGGRSVEAIAREVGRHPSTVVYWAQKHGLTSAHAARHASRGGIPRELLVELVAEGLSTRRIAERLGLSYATVRHWLGKHGVETHRTAQLRATRAGTETVMGAITRECRRHGSTTFVLGRDGYHRCRRCRAESVMRRRARIRREIIADAGGACVICGYSAVPAALQFHHLDPATKAFTLRDGDTRSLERMRAEAAKCVLLCANCHAGVEAGLIQLP